MDYEDSDDFLNDLDPEKINAIFSEACDKEYFSGIEVTGKEGGSFADIEVNPERINSLFRRIY